jgi:Kef-type K+ transport system membrane component KefB
MESKMYFLFQLGILLLGANIGGMISRKLKQPAVLGQIVVGIILGLGFIQKTEFINELSEIGVILLMFIAGLETDVEELKASGKSSTVIAIAGVVVPMILVSGAAFIITKSWAISVILGLITIATSVSISVQTLKEIGQLNTRQGVGILGAAIIDDIIGIILLTIIIGIESPSQGGNVLFVIAKIALFFVIAFVVGYILIKVLSKISQRINLGGVIVAYSIIFCFLLAFSAEELGVAAVTGAYFAGVILSLTPYRHKVAHDVQMIGDAVFIPIFFIGIGLGLDLSALGTGLGFSLLMLALGIIGKIVGCGWGAKVTGFNTRQSLQIGIGMIPRAEVAIIITNLALSLGLIGQQEFASAIVLVVGTTLVTPSLLKWSFRHEVKEAKMN